MSTQPTQPLPDDPLLSGRQRRLLGFTLGFFALVLSAALVVFVVLVLGRLVGYFSEVLWPLAVAGISALIMRPVVERLEVRLKGRRMAAVFVLYGVFVLALAGFALILIPPLASQVLDFFQYLPTFWDNAVDYVQRTYPDWVAISNRALKYPVVAAAWKTVQEQLSELPTIILPSLKAVSHGVFAAFGFVAHLAVVPIYLFFFLLSKGEPTRNLPNHLQFLSPPVRKDVVFLVGEFVAIVVSFFRGQLLIGLIMGGMYALGFTLVGLKFGLFIGLALGVLNIVPYLGTIIGIAVSLPLAFFQPGGGMKLALLVLAVKIVTQNIEGWFLTPKIMGDRTGLHPVMIIVAIFFWGTAFNGILGLILAIPLTAFFVTVWRLLQRKYLNTSN